MEMYQKQSQNTRNMSLVYKGRWDNNANATFICHTLQIANTFTYRIYFQLLPNLYT